MTYAYDAQARLATVTDKMGNAAGQNPLRQQLHDAYDGATRHQTTITAPDGRVRVANIYDSQRRVYQQRDGLNARTKPSRHRMGLRLFDHSRADESGRSLRHKSWVSRERNLRYC